MEENKGLLLKCAIMLYGATMGIYWVMTKYLFCFRVFHTLAIFIYDASVLPFLSPFLLLDQSVTSRTCGSIGAFLSCHGSSTSHAVFLPARRDG